MNNTIFNYSLSDGALVTGAGALTSVITGNPGGLLSGAVLGVTGYLLGKPITNICDKIFGTDQEGAHIIKKIISFVANFFANAGITFGLSALLGYSMTFGSACVFTLVSGGIAFALALITALAITGIQAAVAYKIATA